MNIPLNNIIFLNVTNTIFINNEAVYAGAGVYIRQKQAMGLHNIWKMFSSIAHS